MEGYFVMFRHPMSLLNDDWKIQGSSPTDSYGTWTEANAAAIELHYHHNYDVVVVMMTSPMKLQAHSRMNP